MRRVALLLCKLLLALAVTEATLRLAVQVVLHTPSLAYQPLFHGEALLRHRWVDARSDALNPAYTHDAYDPRTGWTPRPGFRGQANGRGAPLTFTEAGLRGGVEVPTARVPGRRRIVVIGDSFTFGEGVGDDEAYPALLERRLADTDVLNLGVHGYGHDQAVLRYEALGARYRPDVVVLGFVAEDAHRNLLAFRDYAKPRFVPDGADLRLEGTPVPTPDEVRAAHPWRLVTLEVLAGLVRLAGR